MSGTVPITDDGGEEISSYRVRADADIYGIRGAGREKGASALEGMRTETGKKRYGIALEAGTHTFYWKIPELYDMIEHTFDMAEQWGFFRRSRRMKPAWTIRTEYRNCGSRLQIFICRFLSGKIAPGIRLFTKKVIQKPELEQSAAFQKGIGIC